MKNIMNISILFLAVLFTSCSTLEEILIKVSQGVSSSELPQNHRATPIGLSKNYNLPKSYEIAYSYRSDIPFSIIKNIPNNIEALRKTNPDLYISQVVALINQNAKNEYEKIKMVYDLVALKVRYDATSFWANKVPEQNYISVLQSGLAVCEGYSVVFKKFCDELKISSEIIHGYGRGVGSSPISTENPNNFNHAWNLVTINGETYLIDSTWGSGYMEGRLAKQSYTTDWLFLKPEHFIYSHYPENQKAQLLKNPLSVSQFTALAFIKPKYFEIAENSSIQLNKLHIIENSLSFSYDIADGYNLNYSMHDIKTGREIQNRIFINRIGNKETVLLSSPSKGQYSINMFWIKTGTKVGQGCGEFVIGSNSENLVLFPTTYASSAVSLQLISPIEMPLQSGELYNFKIAIESKKNVAVIYGQNFIQLTKDENNIFSGDIQIPLGVKELTLGISDSEHGSYELIAKYSVK